ncbi:mRNA-degrading endonuclease [Hydrococcus rivularis NIES-593]|uniref:mRNA-degrading endonuclease n=1 Tax=Hydrococcus rivularis NIES-593 TaxID=1921803 RepID=A0A1U7H9T8_9CYAN|nr:type II toxin-antitoxin system PemK/MazF family toxin [Hydrococcus rivularis]OKH20324.1 mRNA-degrading endonuclease [Hydrococcus rivularis NIES-593]
MVEEYVPSRGDIIRLSFSPQRGREQAGVRPALVVSPQAYNQISHSILACPITSRLKGWRFEVPLPQGLTTYGVVLSDQIRVFDWQVRNAQFVENAPQELVDEVLARLAPLVT